MAPLRRPWLALLALSWLGTGCGPRAYWMRDEAARIDASARPEAFTAQTPGAQGIQLGEDAPPLAPAAQGGDRPPCCGLARTVHAWGTYGVNQGHGLRPRFLYQGKTLGRARP